MNIQTKAAPFHEGELRAQTLAGGGPGGFAIRDAMPDQHRTFFPMLQYLLVTTTDDDGWPVAGIVTGPKGFATSPDPHSLDIATSAQWLHGMQSHLRPGKSVGLLGIDLATRRRNRLNGVIDHVDGSGLHLHVRQSFGNCPRYIQLRDVLPADHGKIAVTDSVDRFTTLNDAAHMMLANADTLFVASNVDGAAMREGGPDISHKGGKPGFIHVAGDTLTVPDFNGNRYFNTFGNLMMDDRAALLLIDFTNGDVMHLQGTAEVLWDSPDVKKIEGAERLWRFHLKRGWMGKRLLPLRWTFNGYSPATSDTGTWADR